VSDSDVLRGLWWEHNSPPFGYRLGIYNFSVKYNFSVRKPPNYPWEAWIVRSDGTQVAPKLFRTLAEAMRHCEATLWEQLTGHEKLALVRAANPAIARRNAG
jgi:hypothetical protein